MTIIRCDICNGIMSDYSIKIKVQDGEHPHNGDTCYKVIDCCIGCVEDIISKIGPLCLYVEYDDIVEKLKNE